MDAAKALPFLMIWDMWHKTKYPKAAAGLGPNGLTCHSLHLHFTLPILVSDVCCSLGLVRSLSPCISTKTTNPEIIIVYFTVTLTLLCSIAKATGFVWAGGLGGAVHSRQLAILPAAHTQQEAHHITLLLAPHLLHVLVCPHDDRLACKNKTVVVCPYGDTDNSDRLSLKNKTQLWFSFSLNLNEKLCIRMRTEIPVHYLKNWKQWNEKKTHQFWAEYRRKTQVVQSILQGVFIAIPMCWHSTTKSGQLLSKYLSHIWVIKWQVLWFHKCCCFYYHGPHSTHTFNDSCSSTLTTVTSFATHLNIVVVYVRVKQAY